jgi:hypothetical protein
VSAFGGRIAKESVVTTGTGSALCTFSVAKTRFGSNVSVSVSLHQRLSAAAFEQGKSQALKDGAVSVSGVGDDAYFSARTQTLQFMRGSTGGSIRVTVEPTRNGGGTSGAIDTDIIKLGQIVAAHL